MSAKTTPTMTHNMEDEWSPRMASTFRLQWEESQGCYVILYPEGLIQLSMSAGDILKRCTGEHSVAAIIRELQAEYEETELETDVRNFLQEALSNGWIQSGKTKE